MNSLYDTIKRLVSDIDLKVYVNVVSNNVVKSCNTLYLQENSTVIDADSNEYTVSAITVNGEITLVPTVVGVVFSGEWLEITNNNPTYLTGRPRSANSEYLQMNHLTREKVPLIWLLTDYDEVLSGEDASVISVDDVRVFFLTETDERQWITEEHYSIAISRMQNLVNRFLERVKRDAKTNYFRTVKSPKERFGVYVESGSSKKIIEDDLSGVELRLNLEISKCC